ncbi:MAG: phosphatase PAP2 family protein [Bacillota bacterium]|nr:phosphatase PAP2 family protein [Bacillota bacterium]
MTNFIHNFDASILLFIKNNMHNSLIDKLMIFFTSLGNAGTVWIVSALALLINKRTRKAGYTVVIALLLGYIFGDCILKNIVHRLRPCTYILQSQLLISKPAGYSFPSGHSGSSFAAAGVISKYFKKTSIGVYIVAFLIAFSRLYLYVHYPTDVLAGIVLGIICSRVAIYIVCIKDYRRECSK